MTDDNSKEKDEIELMDLFSLLWRRKWIIIGIVLFSVLIEIVFIATQQKKQFRSEIEVVLNFEGIEEGINPDGTIFNGRDLISASVLRRLNLDLDLTKHILVEPVIPKYVQKNIYKQGGATYHPNKFKITLINKNEFLFGSKNRSAAVLEDLVEEYREVFKERFIDEPIITFEFSEDFANATEYDGILQVYKQRLGFLEGIITQLEFLEGILTQRKVGAFHLNKKSHAFYSILKDVFILRTTELENVSTKITQFYFVKDKSSFSEKISNDLKNAEYEKMRNEKMAEMSLNLLKTVISESGQGGEQSSPSAIKVMADSSGLGRPTKKDYMSYLIKYNLEAKNAAIENSIDIVKLKDRIEGLKNSGKIISITEQEIIDDLKSIQVRIIELSKKTNILCKEYFKVKFSDIIRPVKNSRHIVEYEYNTRLVTAITLIGSLFIAFFVVLLTDYIIRHKENKSM